MKIISRCHRGQRGNAMVLSALILLSLTSVGVVSIQRTNTDLMVAGNVARAAQAYLAGEAGLTHSIATVGANPQAWTKYAMLLRKLNQANNHSPLPGPDGVSRIPAPRLGFNLLQRSSAVPDRTGAGKPHHLQVMEGAEALARLQQDLAYDSDLVFLNEVEGALGSQVDGDFCFQLFEYNARGGIPASEEEVLDTLCDRDAVDCRPDTVVVEVRARTIAGPTQCNQR